MNICKNHILGICYLYTKNFGELDKCPMYIGHYLTLQDERILLRHYRCPNCNEKINYEEYDKYRELVKQNDAFCNVFISTINNKIKEQNVYFSLNGVCYECLHSDSDFGLNLNNYGAHTIKFSITHTRFIGTYKNSRIPEEIKEYLKNYMPNLIGSLSEGFK